MTSKVDEFAQRVADYVLNECGQDIDLVSVDLPVEMWGAHMKVEAAIAKATGRRAVSTMRWVRVVNVHLHSGGE